MAEDFKKELFSATNDSTGDFVIDLEGVDMVDSVGIGVIIATHNTLIQKGRNLKVINVSKDVYGLFSTMRPQQAFYHWRVMYSGGVLEAGYVAEKRLCPNRFCPVCYGCFVCGVWWG